MLSSDFAPLVEGDAAAPEGFRPLGSAPEVSSDPVPTPDPIAAAVAEARAAAFEEGRAAGLAEARAELAPVAQGFVDAVAAVAAFQQAARERYERELLLVALGVARTVVQRELTERPSLWLDMLRAAIQRTVDRERVVVRVPAALGEFLREHAAEVKVALAEVKEVEIVDDPGLPPSGCILESRFGEIDLGVETQLEQVERTLVRTEE